MDWRPIVENAVEEAVNFAANQVFNEGNHRTALLSIFEAISYAGLHITDDVDVFRLYMNLRPLTVSIELG